MKRLSMFYLLIVFLAVGLIACGGNDDDDSAAADASVKPPTTTPKPAEVEPGVQRDINFEAEDAALKEVFVKHAESIVTKDTDEIMKFWLNKNSDDVFTAWVFWAGAFEKNVGWDDIKNGWVGIFRLHGGVMTVDITNLAIDTRGKTAVLNGKYKWAVSGDFIAAMEKDNKGNWKIRAIDYTSGRFGKQVKAMVNPGYKNPA
jgi:hypothetical protein